MPDTTHELIRQTAVHVRRRDFFWIGGGAVVIFAGLSAIGGASGAAAGAGALLFLAVLFARYKFMARGAWADPVETAVEAALSAKDEELESLRLIRGVVAVFPEPIFLVSAEGRVELANSAAESFVGAECEGRPLSNVLRTPAILTAVADVREGLPEHAVDFIPPGAVERNWRAFVAPMQVNSDERNVVVLLRDLTSERRLERMRADFVASASHELRTPLASLLGFIETLRGHAKGDPKAQDRFLAIMEDQAQRMGRLIEDLMSLSRIELNEHVTPEEPVDLENVVADVQDGLAPVSKAKNAQIEFVNHCKDEQAIAIGDRDEIIQVVQNLVDNALKYGREGGVIRIMIGRGSPEIFASGETPANRTGDAVGQIAAREGLTTSDFFYIQVCDDGEGIARSDLPRVTERFYRVDVQRSRQTGGTGLGLAIVKHIVNRHRGGLQVESVVGAGSAFTVFFRRKS